MRETKRNIGDTETGRNWQQQEATTLYSGMNRRSSNIVWIQCQELLKENGNSAGTCLTGAGTMDEERVWWKLGSWRRCSPFRERERRPLWLLVSCSAPLHLQSLNLPGSQLARSLRNILSEHKTIREWTCTTSYSGPAYLSSFSPATTPSLAYSALHPKNLISVSSIFFVPSVFVHPFTPIQKGQKRGHTFAFSRVPGYPQQCFGS